MLYHSNMQQAQGQCTICVTQWTASCLPFPRIPTFYELICYYTHIFICGALSSYASLPRIFTNTSIIACAGSSDQMRLPASYEHVYDRYRYMVYARCRNAQHCGIACVSAIVGGLWVGMVRCCACMHGTFAVMGMLHWMVFRFSKQHKKEHTPTRRRLHQCVYDGRRCVIKYCNL